MLAYCWREDSHAVEALKCRGAATKSGSGTIQCSLAGATKKTGGKLVCTSLEIEDATAPFIHECLEKEWQQQIYSAPA